MWNSKLGSESDKVAGMEDKDQAPEGVGGRGLDYAAHLPNDIDIVGG